MEKATVVLTAGGKVHVRCEFTDVTANVLELAVDEGGESNVVAYFASGAWAYVLFEKEAK